MGNLSKLNYSQNLCRIDARDCAKLLLDYLPDTIGHIDELLSTDRQQLTSILDALFDLRISTICINIVDDLRLFGRLIQLLSTDSSNELRIVELIRKWPSLCDTNDDTVLRCVRRANLISPTVILLEYRLQFDEAFNLLIDRLERSRNDIDQFGNI